MELENDPLIALSFQKQLLVNLSSENKLGQSKYNFCENTSKIAVFGDLFETMEHDNLETEENLEQDLLNELVCPLCKFYMAPPIQQCTIGHNFCKECFELLTHCSRCYSPKGTTRNYLLEKIYYKVNLPCKFAGNGCEFTGKEEMLRQHEKICSYYIRKCPFNFTCLCSWKGLIYDIKEHCFELHPYTSFQGPEFSKVFFNFDECFDGYSMYMIFAHNALFRFTYSIEKASKMVKFSVYFLGEPSGDNKFMYEIKFLRHGTERSAIALKATCSYLADHTQAFSGRNYMMMPLDVLKPFCDREGDLHYVIRIMDNTMSSAVCEPSTSKQGL